MAQIVHAPTGEARDRAEEWAYRRVRLHALTSLGRQLIQVGGAVFSVYLIYRMVGILAGETTTANIGVRFLANIHVATATAWTLGVAGVLYGVHQRRLRKTVVARLTARTQALEKEIDPRRSSSKLTPQGDTHPEDRL